MRCWLNQVVVEKYRLSFNLESPVNSAEHPILPRGDLQERRRRWSGGAAFRNGGGQLPPVPQFFTESTAQISG